MWLVLAVLVVVVIPAVIIAVLRNEGRRSADRANRAVVEVDSAGVRRHLADGGVEEVWWSEVTEVEVLRAGVGPHRRSGGVILVGGGPERGALVPLDRIEILGLRPHLRALPGFDETRLDAAVVARAPSRTVVWTSDPPGGDDPG
jgi:hypothetical protein